MAKSVLLNYKVYIWEYFFCLKGSRVNFLVNCITTKSQNHVSHISIASQPHLRFIYIPLSFHILHVYVYHPHISHCLRHISDMSFLNLNRNISTIYNHHFNLDTDMLYLFLYLSLLSASANSHLNLNLNRISTSATLQVTASLNCVYTLATLLPEMLQNYPNTSQMVTRICHMLVIIQISSKCYSHINHKSAKCQPHVTCHILYFSLYKRNCHIHQVSL